ncbi:MAG: DMT family transporter [Kiloniellales bacterium]
MPDVDQNVRAAAAAAPHGKTDPLYLRGVALVMLAGVFWSLAGILVRNVEAADPWQILFVRSASAFATLLVILMVRYRGQTPAQVRRAGMNGLVGGLCLALAMSCFIFALTHTTIANAVFILSVSPLSTAILAWLLLGERVLRQTWMAIAVAMIGLAVMVGDGISAGALLGNVMALIAVLGFSGFAVALRRGREADMLPAACLATLFATLAAAAMVPDFAISKHDVLFCVIMGVVQIGIGTMLFTAGSRHLPAAELALLSLTEVILGPFWVWLGVGEVPRLLTLVGGAIVLVAIAGRAATGLRRKPAPIGSV